MPKRSFVRWWMLLLVTTVGVATAAPAGAVAGFGDVEPNRYYTAAVQWSVDQGITSGTAPGCFSPDAFATRAEVAVFLHRLEGEPRGGSEPFVDVGSGAFYAEAVAWMSSNGITTGTTPTTFSPDRFVTRGEFATFVHRVADRPSGGAEPFIDVDTTDFFAAAVAWMASSGITTGTSPTTFSPERLVSRAEVVTLLYRYAGEPAVNVDTAGVCSVEAHADLTEAEQLSLALLNDLRAGRGLEPLVPSATMNAFARDWSSVMHDTGNFEHSRGPYGENIAWWSRGAASPAEAADVMHDLWINSPGHLRNMLNDGYREVGIGFWRGDGGWYATHVFR